MTAGSGASPALVCIPFAGAGASFYRPWQQLAGPAMPVVPLQLPGREWRLSEKPCRTVAEAVAALLPEAVEAVDQHGEVALFGHSLGAVIAYELAHRLGESYGDVVARLVVSGSPAPWSGRVERAGTLADDEFLGRVEEFAGYTHEALTDPEMRELILPTLRADVRMHEEYQPSFTDPIEAPVTAVRGLQDHLVSLSDVAAWGSATRAGFAVKEFDGGHMYLVDQAPALLRAIAASLPASSRRESPAPEEVTGYAAG
ncbi:thioesterase II family protein [Micromonospora sp. CA-248089]|uniref:thioesterase II family protein n=1 Tax=Micromonospora sp. CA-248089 TaxID=3239960 RepID=UPI003D8D088B